MRSNYRTLGNFIKQVDSRNHDLSVTDLKGIRINKEFMPSVANTNGTDLSKYKVVRKGQFAYNPMHVGRDEVLPISLLLDDEQVIVSPAYAVFEIIDTEQLNPEYLMMWFRRSEFDRNAWFTTDNSVRGGFNWDSLCEMQLPVPSIEKQREIVEEYNTIVNRIKLNEQLNQKLEETAQALYKHWFVDFEFPISKEYAESIGKPEQERKPYKSSGGEMVWNEELGKDVPAGWGVVPLKAICIKIGSGSTPKGGRHSYGNTGVSLIRSMNVYDLNFRYENLAYIGKEQAKKLNNVSLSEDDLLLNITGVSVARCCIVPKFVLPSRVNQHVAIIRFSNAIATPFYFLFALCSQDYKNRLLGVSHAGSTRQALTKKDIQNLKVLIPNDIIRNYFNNMIQKMFKLKEEFDSEKNLLVRIKEIILAKLTKINIIKEVAL